MEIIMKIKKGFVMRRVMGNYVVVAVGEASKKFRGMIKLNETAAEVWKGIDKGLSKLEICDAICEEYEVERDVVERDVEKVVGELVANGFVTD